MGRQWTKLVGPARSNLSARRSSTPIRLQPSPTRLRGRRRRASAPHPEVLAGFRRRSPGARWTAASSIFHLARRRRQPRLRRRGRHHRRRPARHRRQLADEGSWQAYARQFSPTHGSGRRRLHSPAGWNINSPASAPLPGGGEKVYVDRDSAKAGSIVQPDPERAPRRRLARFRARTDHRACRPTRRRDDDARSPSLFPGAPNTRWSSPQGRQDQLRRH